MTKRIIPQSENPPKELLSKKTLAGMSLTVDDQKWIKILLDTQNEVFNDAFDTNIKELTGALAEVIQAQNVKVFAVMETQTESIKRISSNVDRIVGRLDVIENRLVSIEKSGNDRERRIAFLERYASIPQTIMRHAIGVFIGLMVGLGIGYWLHSLIR
jgi:hypothetical protein